jgi:hypothetical protein
MQKMKGTLIPYSIIIKMTKETEKTKHVISKFEPKDFLVIMNNKKHFLKSVLSEFSHNMHNDLERITIKDPTIIDYLAEGRKYMERTIGKENTKKLL